MAFFAIRLCRYGEFSMVIIRIKSLTISKNKIIKNLLTLYLNKIRAV